MADDRRRLRMSLEVLMSTVVTALTSPRRPRTLPGVYAPQHDTHLLLQALCREGIRPGSALLDIGTGSGVLAVQAARLGAQVTAVDVARRAVLTTRLNAFLARQRVTVHRGDLTPPVHCPAYDVVVSNPPYVPAPLDRPPRRGAARSWDAGLDGRAVVDRICRTAPSLLRRGGVLLMVHSDLCGTDATLRSLSQSGFRAAVSDRALVPFGPVLLSRLPWLRGQNLLEDSADKEELVVIRAERR